MNPKTTAVLFALAAALAAFVYFYEIEGEEARVEAEAAEKRLFPDVEQSDITSISLRTSDAPEIELERRDGRWRIVTPIDFVADTFAADGVASAITQLMSESVIEDPQPLDVYALGEAGAAVHFTVGDRERTLWIGSATPVGSNSYASADGGDRVFTVASYQLSSFKKELDDLRDKRIVDFDPASVRRVAVSWPEGGVVVERSDAGWQMVAPLETSADADSVERLLSNLSFLKTSAFVDDPGTDEETGFAPPQFAVELELSSEAGGSDSEAIGADSEAIGADSEAVGADSEAVGVNSEAGGSDPEAGGSDPKTLRVAVGGVDESGSQRFVRGAVESLYLISQEDFDAFPRRVVEYRNRRLAEFATDDVRRVELGFHTDTGETVSVRITREDGGWASSAEPIQPDQIDGLVSVLSGLHADEIIAEELGSAELQAMGLDPAKAVLLVYGAGDPEERLAEIHLGVAFSDGITARIPERDTIFQIDAALADAIPADLDDFRARFVAPPKPAADPPAAGVDAETAVGAGSDEG